MIETVAINQLEARRKRMSPSRRRRVTASPIATIELPAPSPEGGHTDAPLHHSDGARAGGSDRRLRRACRQNGGNAGGVIKCAGRAGREGRAGPRSGHAPLSTLSRGDTGDHDDSGGDAASRRPAAREAVRDTTVTPGLGKWPPRSPLNRSRPRYSNRVNPAAAVSGGGPRESEQDFEGARPTA